MAISNISVTFSCFSGPTRFHPLWRCSLTRKGGEISFYRFFHRDSIFAYPNLRHRPLSALGRFGSSGGAGVLERPSFDQSQFDLVAEVEEGGDIGKLVSEKGPKSGDSYKVLLVDDARHTENLVVKVLPQVVPSVTPEHARSLFYASQQNGVAVVIVALKEHAEFYAQMMTWKGLRAAIEPESTTA